MSTVPRRRDEHGGADTSVHAADRVVVLLTWCQGEDRPARFRHAPHAESRCRPRVRRLPPGSRDPPIDTSVFAPRPSTDSVNGVRRSTTSTASSARPRPSSAAASASGSGRRPEDRPPPGAGLRHSGPRRSRVPCGTLRPQPCGSHRPAGSRYPPPVVSHRPRGRGPNGSATSALRSPGTHRVDERTAQLGLRFGCDAIRAR